MIDFIEESYSLSSINSTTPPEKAGGVQRNKSIFFVYLTIIIVGAAISRPRDLEQITTASGGH